MPEIRALPRFPEVELDRALKALTRASTGAAPDRAAVELGLREILHATGLAHDATEEARDWEALAAARPDHKALRTAFRSIAEAPDPLAAARARREVLPGLNAQLRALWQPRWPRAGSAGTPSVRTVTWRILTEAERAEVRQICRDLARFHGGFVHRGRPQSNDADTALRLLADTFRQFTGQQRAWYEVPFAEDGHFVEFAVAALRPIAMSFEVTEKAISERWRRLVRDVRQEDRVQAAVDPTD